MNGEEILNEVRLMINNAQFTRYNEINRAYRRLAHASPASWLREESEEKLVFLADTEEYTLNIAGMRRITALWVYGTDSGEVRWHLVEEVDQKLFEVKKAQHINLDGEDRTGLPEYFKMISVQPGQIKLALVPTPDAEMEAKVDYIKDVAEIGRLTVPEMPAAYHDIIAQLAAGYILRSEGKPMGQVFVTEAIQQANMLMMDSTANRNLNIDRPARPWIRSSYNRYGYYNQFGTRYKRY